MPNTLFYSTHRGPLGESLLLSDGEALSGLYLPNAKYRPQPAPNWARRDDGFRDVRSQLDEYFAGTRTSFELPLRPAGTAFQLQVWNELLNIPCGETATYAGIAARLGKPTAIRAVGAANGRNPISIIVPCHRVVGADGSLTGYAGGLECKKWLLEHEAGVAHQR